MEKRTKIIIGIIIIAIIAFLIYTNILLVIFAITLNSFGLYNSGVTLQLSEYPEDKLALGEIVNISEDDFKKYPEIRELFDNINKTDPYYMGDIRFISKATVYRDTFDEIYEKYGPGKILYWNDNYYSILAEKE
jgi:hypothetical protein